MKKFFKIIFLFLIVSLCTSFGYYNEIEDIKDVKVKNNNIYILVSTYGEKTYLLKYDKYGNLDKTFANNGVFPILYPLKYPERTIPIGIQINDKGNIHIFLSSIFGEEFLSDIYVIKLKPNGQIDQEFGTNLNIDINGDDKKDHGMIIGAFHENYIQITNKLFANNTQESSINIITFDDNKKIEKKITIKDKDNVNYDCMLENDKIYVYKTVEGKNKLEITIYKGFTVFEDFSKNSKLATIILPKDTYLRDLQIDRESNFYAFISNDNRKYVIKIRDGKIDKNWGKYLTSPKIYGIELPSPPGDMYYTLKVLENGEILIIFQEEPTLEYTPEYCYLLKLDKKGKIPKEFSKSKNGIKFKGQSIKIFDKIDDNNILISLKNDDNFYLLSLNCSDGSINPNFGKSLDDLNYDKKKDNGIIISADLNEVDLEPKASNYKATKKINTKNKTYNLEIETINIQDEEKFIISPYIITPYIENYLEKDKNFIIIEKENLPSFYIKIKYPSPGKVPLRKILTDKENNLYFIFLEDKWDKSKTIILKMTKDGKFDENYGNNYWEDLDGDKKPEKAFIIENFEANTEKILITESGTLFVGNISSSTPTLLKVDSQITTINFDVPYHDVSVFKSKDNNKIFVVLTRDGYENYFLALDIQKIANNKIKIKNQDMLAQDMLSFDFFIGHVLEKQNIYIIGHTFEERASRADIFYFPKDIKILIINDKKIIDDIIIKNIPIGKEKISKHNEIISANFDNDGNILIKARSLDYDQEFTIRVLEK